MKLIKRMVFAVCVVALGFGWPDHGWAQDTGRKPLLMEGKETLSRKVLMRPDSQIFDGPQGNPVSRAVPFSINFVYGEATSGGEQWLEIGPDQVGTIAGWVPAGKTAEWRQTMTLAFTNPAGRERTLFFRSRDELEELLGSNSLLVDSESYREKIRRGTLPPDSPIVSIEPENHIDIHEQFYLLPILEAEEVYLDSGFPVTLLQISSVSDAYNEQTGEGASASNQPPPPTPASDHKLKSAITFVIDATSSMGPYIEQVREAVGEIYDVIQANDLTDDVRFGLVSYRDNVEAAPGLEYDARMYADPNRVSSADDFLAQVSGLEPARASSKGFIEDAYSGLESALTSVDWGAYSGRFLILVTDAGAREGNDPLSGTKMSTVQIRQLAASQNVYTYVMHLKTPEGQSDHDAASRQYTQLARFNDGSNRSLYFPIESGDVARFGTVVRRIGEQLAKQIQTFNTNGGTESQLEEVAETRDKLEAATNEQDRLDRELEYNTALVGLAIKLAYVGERDTSKAPSMFSAWLTDRSFRDPDRAVVDVRVLLTKNQLSDLQQTLQQILEASERGQIAPDSFFANLRAAAAAMGRAPDQIATAESLTDLGIVGEYLDGLPYRSQVMNVTEDVWTGWSIGQQQVFIDTLRSKIELYRYFHDSTENWVLLNPDAPPGEAVYPVPLDALP